MNMCMPLKVHYGDGRSFVFPGFTLQDVQFVAQVLIKLLFDGLKLLISIADIQDEGIHSPTDYPGS